MRLPSAEDSDQDAFGASEATEGAPLEDVDARVAAGPFLQEQLPSVSGTNSSRGVVIDLEPLPTVGSSAHRWCSLCGSMLGWMPCGCCDGTGGYPTQPGLAGVKDRVGWARCKVCFGRGHVPCIFCGVRDAEQWRAWQEYAKRHPRRLPPP